MKHRLTHIVATTLLIFGFISGVHAANSDQKRIQTLLKTYEQALNAGDVPGVLKLYAQDGVFMAQHNSPAVGIDAIEAAYQAVFTAISLDIRFDVLETGILADDWAFARTSSAGTTTINATGDKVVESNQELFLLRKTGDGNWKIARYIFSTTNPR